MPRANYFPRIELPNGRGRIDIFGIWHTTQVTSVPTGLPAKDMDYFVTDDTPFRDAESSQPDYIAAFLRSLPHSGMDLGERTEKAEFYLDELFGPVDYLIRESNALSIVVPEEQRDITFFEPEEVESFKRSKIDALDGRIRGVSREEIEAYMRKLVDARALLLANIISHRAEALGQYGGNVKVIVTPSFPGYLERFLEDPEETKRRLADCPEAARYLYAINEAMQQRVDAAFHAAAKEFCPPLEKMPELLRHAVDFSNEYYLEEALHRRGLRS